MLETAREVVRCLVTYSDWWQPSTGSVLQVARAKSDKTIGDGINPGLVETLEERTELCRRMSMVEPRYRKLLFLWYVAQLHVDDIAAEMRISRRQCFRLKTRAIEMLTGTQRGTADAAVTAGGA